MTPDELAAKKATLDDRLIRGPAKTIFSVGFGLELYSELCRTGDIHWGEFGNMAHRVEVPHAPRRLTLPAYGTSEMVVAIPKPSMRPDEFLVGSGGFEV